MCVYVIRTIKKMTRLLDSSYFTLLERRVVGDYEYQWLITIYIFFSRVKFISKS